MIYVILGGGLIAAALAQRWRGMRSFRTEQRVAEAYTVVALLTTLINWGAW